MIPAQQWGVPPLNIIIESAAAQLHLVTGYPVRGLLTTQTSVRAFCTCLPGASGAERAHALIRMK